MLNFQQESHGKYKKRKQDKKNKNHVPNKFEEASVI